MRLAEGVQVDSRCLHVPVLLKGWGAGPKPTGPPSGLSRLRQWVGLYGFYRTNPAGHTWTTTGTDMVAQPGPLYRGRAGGDTGG